MMATYNSAKNSSDINSKMRSVINYSTKSIEIIQSLTTKPQGSLAMIYYNSLYLRAMAKINFRDKTAIDDLILVNKEQPELVSSDSIDVYKRILGIL